MDERRSKPFAGHNKIVATEVSNTYIIPGYVIAANILYWRIDFRVERDRNDNVQPVIVVSPRARVDHMEIITDTMEMYIIRNPFVDAHTHIKRLIYYYYY
jgi:hypothetical protein